MKPLLFLLLLLAPSLRAATVVPSALDPGYAGRREGSFEPWGTGEQAGLIWKQKSSDHIPVYQERKAGGLQRDLYIPNPGAGYWVLGGMSEADLLKVQREKLKINDTLVSATVFVDQDGRKTYWALWANRDRAHLIIDSMRDLGISQARVDYSLFEKFGLWYATLDSFGRFITLGSLILNLILSALVILLALLLIIRRRI